MSQLKKHIIFLFSTLVGFSLFGQVELNDSTVVQTELSFSEILEMKEGSFKYVYHLTITVESNFEEKANLVLIQKLINLKSLSVSFVKGAKIEPVSTVLSGILPSLKQIEKVRIYVDSSENFPDFFLKCENLKRLECNGRYYKNFPDSIGHLQKLNGFIISGETLEELPISIGNLTALKGLFITLPRLKIIPKSISKLSLLKELEIESWVIEKIPNSVNQLNSLNGLKLTLPHLKKLPKSFSNLKDLDYLHIVGCKYLKKLPKGLAHLPKLITVKMYGAENLKNLNSIKESKNLQELIITGSKYSIILQVAPTLPKLFELGIDLNQLSGLDENELKILKQLKINTLRIVLVSHLFLNDKFIFKHNNLSSSQRKTFKDQFSEFDVSF